MTGSCTSAADTSNTAGHEVLYVRTIEGLTSAPTADKDAHEVRFVLGYSVPGDGGGGTFTQCSSTENIPNGVTIFRSGSADYSWCRYLSSPGFYPEMAGALGDGVHDDIPAFNRLIALSKAVGAFQIHLRPGRKYYLASMLDLSLGAAGLSVIGPASPMFDLPSGLPSAPISRLELNGDIEAPIKLGSAQNLVNVLVWRHGLKDAPTSLAEVRAAVNKWFLENGQSHPLSIGVFAPFDDIKIENTRIIGFNTGVKLAGGRFILRDIQIDTAGYALDIGPSSATSLIENVASGGLWSRPVHGKDALGGSDYRPGVAYYIHDGADGLTLNSLGAEGWVGGILFDGTKTRTDWLITATLPDIETPPNSGNMTFGIRTLGEVRRITVIDPRVVTGGLGAGQSIGLDFSHQSTSPAADENNNVKVIGGTIEVAGNEGVAVRLGPGSSGSLIALTMNMAHGGQNGPLVVSSGGLGRWDIVAPDIRGPHNASWLSKQDKGSSSINISQ